MEGMARRTSFTTGSTISGPVVVPATDRLVILNEKRNAVLQDIGNAQLSWYHARTCLVAGIGFFTDSYDLFAISLAAPMLGYIYGRDGKLSQSQQLGIKIAAPIGNFFGQLFFGWLADVIGRKRMYGVELVIMITGTFAQTLCGQSDAVSIIGSLVVWRFITGVGVGGDYPLSSVITSEFAATRVRGRMMTAVFSAQGWGTCTAALVSMIVVSAYKRRIEDGPLDFRDVDYCWRILIGLGCVPGVFGLYFRFTIPETPRYTLDIERNLALARRNVDLYYEHGTYTRGNDVVTLRIVTPIASHRDFFNYFSQWENGKVLLGTAWSWFAIDFSYYGLGLNSSTILEEIGFGEAATGSPQVVTFTDLRNISVGNLIISIAGLIPGYYASMFFIDRPGYGRKPIQYMGFTMLAIIFSCMGFGYDRMVHHGASGAFVFLYCLANFFQNFGPNTTTFIIPGEVFPTRYRSTGHGVSAACGKFGAIIAQIIVVYTNFQDHMFEIFALFMITGIFSTMLLPETMGRTLEELSNESQDTFVQGERQPPVSLDHSMVEVNSVRTSVGEVPRDIV